jgi:hypothetical protein
MIPSRFYRAFLRQWEGRTGMFFPKEEWQEALLDRFHIYEDCSRIDICDMIQLQIFYRNLLARLPWTEILPLDLSCDLRVHWCLKSDAYRNLVDQIIGCGPLFILNLLSLPSEMSIPILRQCLSIFESGERQLRYSCFDDVMAKLLTRLDGGSQAAGRWEEEESYFDICATSTNWFCEPNIRSSPIRYRLLQLY